MRRDLMSIALTVRCDYCNAAPEVWCTTVSGATATWLHASRINPVYEAYSQGYGDGRNDAKELAR